MWYSSIPIHRIKKKTQLRLRFHRALSTCLMMPWGQFTPHQREKHLFIFCCKNEKHKTNQCSHQDKSKFTQESKMPWLKAFEAGGHISQSSFPTVVGCALAQSWDEQSSTGGSPSFVWRTCGQHNLAGHLKLPLAHGKLPYPQLLVTLVVLQFFKALSFFCFLHFCPPSTVVR